MMVTLYVWRGLRLRLTADRWPFECWPDAVPCFRMSREQAWFWLYVSAGWCCWSAQAMQIHRFPSASVYATVFGIHVDASLLPDGPFLSVPPAFTGPPLIEGSFPETVRWLFNRGGGDGARQ